MNLSTAINYCKTKGAGKRDIKYTQFARETSLQIAAWLQELKIRRTLGAAAICDLEFPLLQENEIERDKFIVKYVERASVPVL